MNPNRSNSSPNTPTAPPPRPDPAPIDPDRYKVGAELEGVTSAAGEGESVSQPRENRATTAKQPPRSMCFMVEDCKWCRRILEGPPRSDRGAVPEKQEEPESMAANALRECLEMLERERLNMTPAAHASLVQLCLDTLCRKGV